MIQIRNELWINDIFYYILRYVCLFIENIFNRLNINRKGVVGCFEKNFGSLVLQCDDLLGIELLDVSKNREEKFLLE